MRVRSSLPAIVAILSLVPVVGCLAQVDDPWQSPGTKAGDEIVGPDGGRYVWVPPGEFDMGSSDGKERERPVHHISISRGFWLAKCSVTNAQYRRFCQATGEEFPPESDQPDDHPVTSVTWEGAAAYSLHHGLRLPTEAEWEYAARGPESRVYPWGDDWDATRCSNAENMKPGTTTVPVGSFATGASWCGALDMAGNAEQWCSDRYDENYYAVSPPVDPAGPPTGRSRVRRGSCYDDDGRRCRSANRSFATLYVRVDFVGFRCVVSPKRP